MRTGALALALCGCVSFAAPPPLITLGGPRLAPEGGTQLGIGVGGGAALFPGAHSGGDGWFGRFRYGLSGADVGADVMGLRRADDKGTFTGKLAFRARLGPRMTAELGAGAADDSDGKSVGAEAGLIAGSDRGRTWDAYGALRAAGSLALTHNDVNGKPGAQDAVFGLATAGATAKVAENARFVFEGGAGALAVRHTTGFGRTLYLGVGLVFDLR